MTVTEVLKGNMFNVSELSRQIYGENKPTYLYCKINKKRGLSMKDADFALVGDYFTKTFKINLELI